MTATAAEPRLRFTANQLAETATEEFSTAWGDARSAELVISADGLVRDGRYQVGEVGETEQFMKNSFTIEAIGETTIGKPNWIDEAQSAKSN